MARVILLVSDIPDHIPQYEDAFRRRGYRTVTSSTHADAFARATTTPPDCLVIDERVAGMSGWDLCRRLKADLRVRPVPIVMLVHDLSKEGGGPERRGAGCNSWLARPTAAADIVGAVDYVISLNVSTPVDRDEAIIGLRRCGSCGSDRIRAGVRIGPVQYYSCLACGLFWCDEGVT